MFRTISENKQKIGGKLQPEMSFKSKQSQWAIGNSSIPKWNQTYESVNNKFFHQHPFEKSEKNKQKEEQYQSHFNLMHDGYNDPVNSHFMSETRKQQEKATGMKIEKSRPGRSKQQLMATQFTLGTEEANTFDYTQNREQFYDKSKIQFPNIFKTKNESRFNPITMQQYNEKRVDQASGFDFWKESAPHGRVSRDVAQIPAQGQKYNIINGRTMEYDPVQKKNFVIG